MMGLAVVMSLSRGGMISLVASLMFVVAFGYKPRAREYGRKSQRHSLFPIPLAVSRAGALVLMLFTVGAGVWWVGADPVIRRVEKGELTMDESGSRSGKETFFQSRGRIWRDTATMICANWVTGVGLGAYQTAYPIYTVRDGTTVTSQAHNDYLQILADAGIFGAALALLFIFLVGRDTVRASRHRNPVIAATALGAASGLFALMVHSLFDFNLQIPSNALLFLVLTSVVSRIAHDAQMDAKKGDIAVPERAAILPRVRAAG
jgi:O-antigen ligase